MRPVPNGLFSAESRIEVLRDDGVPLRSEVHAQIAGGGDARRAAADPASERPGPAHPSLDSAPAAERAGARSEARREPQAGTLSSMPSLESLDPGGESVPAPLHVYIRGWHTVGNGATGWVVYDVLIVLRGVRIVRKRRFSEFVALREALKRERPVRTPADSNVQGASHRCPRASRGCGTSIRRTISSIGGARCRSGSATH